MRRIRYSALFALIALSATSLFNSCCCDKDDSTVKDNPVVEVSSVSITDAEGTVLSEIDMYQDSTFQFKVDVQPANATDKSLTYTSDKEEVATVSSSGVITAGAIGTANIKVATKDGKISASLLVRVHDNTYARITRSLTDEGRAAQAVDLGLPSGTLWADRNIGASSESGLGQWFYWGDVIQPEDNVFTQAQYDTLPAHNANADIAHTKFDIATLRWGGEWQLPTKEQILELISECTLTTENGGCRATSKSDPTKSILLPYTANCDHRGWVRGYNNYGWGCYWSSTPEANNKADYFYFNEYDVISLNAGYEPTIRYAGISVRPVQVPPSE